MRVGDRIICIKDYEDKVTGPHLIKNKIYTIESMSSMSSRMEFYRVLNELNFIGGYNIKRFISLKEYRKQKLKRIIC